MPDTGDRRVSGRRHPAMPWLLLAFALLFLGSAMGWRLHSEFRSVGAHERERLATQAKVVANNLGHQLDATNRALSSIRDDLPDLKRHPGGIDLLNRRLRLLSDAMPGVRTLVVLDADGTIIASNRDELIGRNFHDREYFRAPLQSRDLNTLYLSPPYKTVLGSYAMNAGRVIVDARGEFNGVITATLDPEYFVTLLESVLYTPDMWTSLAHGDGKLFLMVPMRPNSEGVDLAKPGSFYTRHLETGQVDTVMTGITHATGEEVMMAQRIIKPADLHMDKHIGVGVARDLSSIYAAWRHEAFEQGLVFLLLLAGASLGLHAHQKRQRAEALAETAREIERRQAEKALRESEARYRLLTENIKDVVWVLDIETLHFLYVSPSVVKLLGHTADEVLAAPMMHVLTPESAARILDRIRSRKVDILSGKVLVDTYYTAEVEQRCKDGSMVWTESIACYYRNPESGRVEARGVTRDITERKHAEAALLQHRNHLEDLVAERTADLSLAKEAAETANRVKSAFLAVMSHELRTPLNGIMGMTELAVRRSTDPKQVDYLNKAQASAKHLLSIINDILDVAKIAGVAEGRIELCMVHFTLDTVMARVMDTSIAAAKRSGVSLTVEVDPHVGRRPLLGDPIRVGQVLDKLVGNAIKFSKAGTVALRVSVVEESANDLLAQFEVQDTGIGIASDDQRRLFTPFEQVDMSATRPFGGIGLGLSIARNLARLMGGDVGVKSEAGAGSTFCFTARFLKDERMPSAEAVAVNEVPEVALKRLHAGASILLAEDEPINSEVVVGLLEATGIHVDVAEDGTRAVDLAGQGDYAAILMDVKMPRTDGLEATRRIRQLPNGATVPIIGLTALAYAEDKRRCLDAGMNDYLAKPIDPVLLYNALLKWMVQT